MQSKTFNTTKQITEANLNKILKNDRLNDWAYWKLQGGETVTVGYTDFGTYVFTKGEVLGKHVDFDDYVEGTNSLRVVNGSEIVDSIWSYDSEKYVTIR